MERSAVGDGAGAVYLCEVIGGGRRLSQGDAVEGDRRRQWDGLLWKEIGDDSGGGGGGDGDGLLCEEIRRRQRLLVLKMVCRVCHSCCEIDNEDRFAIFIHDGPGDLVVEHTMHSKEQVQRDKRHEVQST
ncbi:hypothetical protein ZWY2020_003912 [Hordeum vulgare]|nr:hypothetical protein ZWY2020_003912 [Hordeum vulgare]